MYLGHYKFGFLQVLYDVYVLVCSYLFLIFLYWYEISYLLFFDFWEVNYSEFYISWSEFLWL